MGKQRQYRQEIIGRKKELKGRHMKTRCRVVKVGLREVVWVILPDFTAQAACR